MLVVVVVLLLVSTGVDAGGGDDAGCGNEIERAEDGDAEGGGGGCRERQPGLGKSGRQGGSLLKAYLCYDVSTFAVY